MAKSGIKEGRNRVWVQYYSVRIVAHNEFGNEVFSKRLTLTDWHLKIVDHMLKKLKNEFTKDRQYYIDENEIEDYLTKKAKDADTDK